MPKDIKVELSETYSVYLDTTSDNITKYAEMNAFKNGNDPQKVLDDHERRLKTDLQGTRGWGAFTLWGAFDPPEFREGSPDHDWGGVHFAGGVRYFTKTTDRFKNNLLVGLKAKPGFYVQVVDDQSKKLRFYLRGWMHSDEAMQSKYYWAGENGIRPCYRILISQLHDMTELPGCSAQEIAFRKGNPEQLDLL